MADFGENNTALRLRTSNCVLTIRTLPLEKTLHDASNHLSAVFFHTVISLCRIYSKFNYYVQSIYIQVCSYCCVSKEVQVMGNPIILHTLYEIERPDWLSKYWEILCSKDPDDEIEKAKENSNLPLFLRTNPFKNKSPQVGEHTIEVGKFVFVPVSVSEFDEVEARYFNLGTIDTSEERLVYARDEYELAIDKPKQLSINGHRVLDREGMYGPYYTEVGSFKLNSKQRS